MNTAEDVLLLLVVCFMCLGNYTALMGHFAYSTWQPLPLVVFGSCAAPVVNSAGIANICASTVILFVFPFSAASYSQYKSEDGRASSATRPSSGGSMQTYTVAGTTTSNSPSVNIAIKPGRYAHSVSHKSPGLLCLSALTQAGCMLLLGRRLVALQQE